LARSNQGICQGAERSTRAAAHQDVGNGVQRSRLVVDDRQAGSGRDGNLGQPGRRLNDQ
jgi:hypothetical protein